MNLYNRTLRKLSVGMKQGYDKRILALFVLFSFLFAHPVVAYLGQGDYGAYMAGILRAEKGNFRDEMN